MPPKKTKKQKQVAKKKARTKKHAKDELRDDELEKVSGGRRAGDGLAITGG